MKAIFRVDASLQIGTGHVMRCLTLADALRERGGSCVFICRQHEGHLLDLITQRGHSIAALPLVETQNDFASINDPVHATWLGANWYDDALQTQQTLSGDTVDWLIVDHYALDRRWEQALRHSCRRLMVIDDLADRPHDCDVLLDQNLGRLAEDYDTLLPASALSLIGPQYALLRPEFAKLREFSLQRRVHPRLEQLLVTMGGVDKDNVTGRVLAALKQCQLPEELLITVVMGPHAPWLWQVQHQAKEMPCAARVLVGVSDMATLMAGSDLAIGAAGSTSWERCCLGVPTVQLVLAENQKEVAVALARIGAVLAVNMEMDLHGQIPGVIRQLDTEQLQHLSGCAATVCDGRGASFIAGQLISLMKD